MRGKKTHFILRLSRPTSRIHSWGLQHTPARTYCSPSSCMRSKSQLRLPCRLIEFPTSLWELAIDYTAAHRASSCDFHIHLEYTAHWRAALVLYCSSLSSCDFHVNLYSGILATPIILWDLAAGKAAWDQTCLSLLQRHHRSFATPGRLQCGTPGRSLRQHCRLNL